MNQEEKKKFSERLQIMQEKVCRAQELADYESWAEMNDIARGNVIYGLEQAIQQLCGAVEKLASAVEILAKGKEDEIKS